VAWITSERRGLATWNILKELGACRDHRNSSKGQTGEFGLRGCDGSANLRGSAKSCTIQVAGQRIDDPIGKETDSTPAIGYPFRENKLLARKHPFTALFAYNDISRDRFRSGAIKRTRDCGVPEDISVVRVLTINSLARRMPIQGLTTVAATA